MDDDWEMLYFNTLARNGQGDFDNDGVSDLDEFRAGTDPTNQSSVLRVMRLIRSGPGATLIFWQSVPNRSYAVEYRNQFSFGSWTRLSPSVRASSSIASIRDTDGVPQRFYRVVRLE
jgi:hypothetical protein